MSRVDLNGIELDYAEHGSADGRPLLLIMGLGMQRTAWPESFLDALAARGYRCISFDNRDIGHSTRYAQAKPPALPRLIAGRLLGHAPRLPYRLADIADDGAALLAHLGIPRADVLGISMGGMIAQHLADRHPQRVRRLVLMSTSSGRLGLPLPAARVLRHMLGRPSGRVSVEHATDYMVRLFGLIGSPRYPMAADLMAARARAGVQRAPTGSGVLRQLAAIIADGSRVALLRRLQVPTLILHGSDDPMVPPAHARDLARCLAQARLQLIDGWGHDLPDALAATFAELIDAHSREAGTVPSH